MSNKIIIQTNWQVTFSHLCSVFQVHGPHMTIKQAWRIRDNVLSCTMDDKIVSIQMPP